MEDHRSELPNGHQPSADLSEYTALNRFISTTTTASHAASASDKGSAEPASHPPRWKLWRRARDSTDEKSGGPFQTPSEWLDTDISSGLSEAEVDGRRKKCGWNELASESPNKLLQFIAYFRGPILYVMELALFLAAGLRDWIDFGVIIGILMLNAIVGWYQEKQAADVVASLKGDLAMKATVVRDGEEREILAREVVVGDILILEEGNVIPAEARLICDYSEPDTFAVYREKMAQEGEDPLHEEGESSDDEHKHTEKAIVAADQSAITGESLAVDKFMGDICYYTTSCKKGKAYAMVTASAKDSFVGRTASLVQTAKDQGHFKAVMDSIGTTLLVLVMFWILVAWIGGFYRHLRIATPEDDDNNLLYWTLILLIVGVPVGLPVVTTTTLAVGAAFLARKKAVVQKLTAIESLAGVDVLCTDKTGTLTANKLSVREPYVADGVDVNWMFAVAAIASSHNTRNLDRIDRVTLLALRRYPKAREMLSRPWVTENFTPFDPVSKRITTTCTCEGVRYICAKGAPKAIIKLAGCPKAEAEQYKNKAQEFALRGFRCLAVAVKEGDKEWQFLGLYPMFDPPREDTAQTIAEAQNLGLSVKMLTGDSTAIAKETCKMLALGTEVYNSERLIGLPHHDLVERANGFAEVFPEHKYQVVELLQKRGHLTAMTGDGVNDAPSLKKSDCGIAVEGATEAAQAAADIVFLAPGLNTIVDAIKVSRQIFQRMKAYVQYRIALCLHLEIYLATSMLAIEETIRADLIVFLALFADLATIAVAYDHAHYEPRPVEWQLPRIWVISVVLGVLLAAGTWIMRGTMFLSNGGIIENWGHPQGILFLEVALTENWLIFVTREAHTWPSWQLVSAILGVDIIATLFCVFGWLTGGAVEQTSPSDPATFSEGPTSIVTVIVVWGFSIGVIIVIATVYYLLSRIKWLQNLGRASRSKEEMKMERFLEQLFKLTVEREKDPQSENPRYVLKTRTEDIDADD